jgi:hypothetical protein
MVNGGRRPIELPYTDADGRHRVLHVIDLPDGSPSLALPHRREKLAELIRQGEAEGDDPEALAELRRMLQAVDDWLHSQAQAGGKHAGA